jgi:hypothetical protein
MNGSRKQINSHVNEEMSVRDDLQEAEEQNQLTGGAHYRDYKPDYPQQ